MNQPSVSLGVDPSSGVSLYMQVASRLGERIEVGEWHAGEQLPTEDQLIDAYGVSRVTVRQALRMLVDRGLVVRERGRGTFLRDASLTAGARGVRSFTTEIAQLGMTAGSKVLELQIQPVTAQAATALGLAGDDPVVKISRLRTGDGQPIGVQTGQYPAARFAGLESVSLAGGSLYDLLQRRYGVVPAEARETFRVKGATKPMAEVLGVARGACCFHVERITYDSHGPFEYVESFMRGDRYRIHLSLRNP